MRDVALAACLPIILLALWQGAAMGGLLAPSQSTSPTDILVTLTRLLGETAFLVNVGISLVRLVLGVTLGAILGAFAGVTIAVSPWARRTMAGSLAFMAGIPVVVWIPFWIMLFGTGEVFRIGLIGIAAFFLVYSATYIATRRASGAYFELLQLYEKSTWRGISHVYLPAASSQIFTAVRLSFALGWIILFFVEAAVSEPGSEGLGWFINQARNVGRVEDEFTGLVVLGLLAFVIDTIVARIQREKLHWADAIEDRPPEYVR